MRDSLANLLSIESITQEPHDFSRVECQEKQEKQFLKERIRDISHQLKTPLTTLSIHHELIEMNTSDPSIRQLAAVCEQETDRMSELIKKLLILTRLETNSMTFRMQSESLHSVLLETIERFESRANLELKSLTIQSEETNKMIVCDRFWLIEALSNLVKNALDHTQANDTIRLEVTSSYQSVQIRILDTGEGIDPADFPHIFKRFYRSSHANDQHGIGLGLPLAKAIIEAHHGTIRVQSEKNIGTCFTVNLLLSDKIVNKPS